jgi:hypothetical protein
MDTKALDGYMRLITTTLSMVLTVVLLFITDPGKAETVTQFWNAVLIPAIPTIANIIFVIVRTITDTQKIEAKKELQLAGVLPVVTAATPSVPASLPSTPASLSTASAISILYQYADVEALASTIKAKFKDNLLGAAYEFYDNMQNFDLKRVQPKERVKQATEFVHKSKQLFQEAFVGYTGIPVPADAVLANKAMARYSVKKDYEKANSIECSGKTFIEINNLLGYLDDFITIQQGLDLIGTESENLNWNTLGQVNPPAVGMYAGALLKSS